MSADASSLMSLEIHLSNIHQRRKSIKSFITSIEYILSTKRYDVPLYQNMQFTSIHLHAVYFLFFIKKLLLYLLLSSVFSTLKIANFRLFCQIAWIIRFFFL